jgi:hypothetical protein
MVAGRSMAKGESADEDEARTVRVAMTYSAVTVIWAVVVSLACVAVNVWLR